VPGVRGERRAVMNQAREAVSLPTPLVPGSSSLAPRPSPLTPRPWPLAPLARILALSCLAALPFLAVYLFHYTSPAGEPTGFIQGDMPYYFANGRAIFERGNGFAHPNPYDPDPGSPVIYFHWLTWLLGFGCKKLGADPGLLFVALGILAGIACSSLTYLLVRCVLPDNRYAGILFLFTMWGGGLLCSAQVARNLFHGQSPCYNLFALDPFNGWWFLNWGRNLICPTEAVYHALVAASWLGVLQGNGALALGSAALLAATHPFTGLQLLLMLAGWYTIELWRKRSVPVLLLWLVNVLVLALFFGYYFVFLGSFPQHRILLAQWSLDWTLPPSSMLFAYGPIGLLAAYRLTLGRDKFDGAALFFTVCFAVSLLLVKHDWYASPRQPLHFTRGYLWMPLCLIALPLLHKLLISLEGRMTRVQFVLTMSVLGALALSDNALFLVRQARAQWAGDAEGTYFLTRNEREVLDWIDSHRLEGVLLCPDGNLSFLSAVYTSARPYFGHWSNTPMHRQRVQQMLDWFDKGNIGAWFDQVDYLLLPRQYRPKTGRSEEWTEIHANDEWRLLARAKCVKLTDSAP